MQNVVFLQAMPIWHSEGGGSPAIFQCSSKYSSATAIHFSHLFSILVTTSVSRMSEEVRSFSTLLVYQIVRKVLSFLIIPFMAWDQVI